MSWVKEGQEENSAINYPACQMQLTCFCSRYHRLQLFIKFRLVLCLLMASVADNLRIITMLHKRVRCNASGGIFCLIIWKPDGDRSEEWSSMSMHRLYIWLYIFASVQTVGVERGNRREVMFTAATVLLVFLAPKDNNNWRTVFCEIFLLSFYVCITLNILDTWRVVRDVMLQ